MATKQWIGDKLFIVDEEVADEIERLHALHLERTKLTHKALQDVERLTAELKEERAIVDRIWALFGTPSYEELKGRSIYDLISELQARVETLEGVLNHCAVARLCSHCEAALAATEQEESE